eukprot:TRINITY_DN2163_c0_g1_i1.p1 TRINITY_DN2163_c0_g1~~TRINITY_DN2163_c0_g1_i1.p1  ORF type:complete len:401 (-),score=78.86 TRINITY_DN2163_c0_g1_i1:91-1293(-)
MAGCGAEAADPLTGAVDNSRSSDSTRLPRLRDADALEEAVSTLTSLSNAGSLKPMRPKKESKSLGLSEESNALHTAGFELKEDDVGPKKFDIATVWSHQNYESGKVSEAESYLPASIIDHAIHPDVHLANQNGAEVDQNQFHSVLQPIKPKSYSAALKKGFSISATPFQPPTEAKVSLPEHTKPLVTHSVRKDICPFLLQGCCRYGDYCRNSHSLDSFCPHCEQQVPHGEASLAEHLRSCDEFIAAEEERLQSVDVLCGICHEVVMSTTGARFGLLTCCTHSFCLKCIREWRGTIDHRKEVVRKCPICRKDSYFVVPSDRMITEPTRKERIVEKYKSKMGQIVCRWFDYGRGSCPFGSSCFYAHLNEDGTPYVAPKLKYLETGYGDVQIAKDVRLSDFFE